MSSVPRRAASPTPSAARHRSRRAFLRAGAAVGVAAASAYGLEQVLPGHVLPLVARAAEPVTHATATPTPAATPAVSPDQPPAGFERVLFADDFDGDTLDTTSWLPSRDGYRSGAFNPKSEATFFDPENVTVADGTLRLTLHEAGKTEVWGNTFHLSSGVVSTQDRVTFGDETFVAARIKVPASDGLFPAFWSAAPNVWPPETDMFEFFNTAGQSRPKFNYHPPEGKHTGPTFYGEEGTDYRDSFHVYGMLRSGGMLTPYLDGVAYPEAAVPDEDDAERYLLLNLSAYRDHSPADGSTMEVDWVRVWSA